MARASYLLYRRAQVIRRATNRVLPKLLVHPVAARRCLFVSEGCATLVEGLSEIDSWRTLDSVDIWGRRFAARSPVLERLVQHKLSSGHTMRKIKLDYGSFGRLGTRGGKFILPLLMTAMSGLALGQGFPDKRITLIVNQPPGGALDSSARLLATAVSKRTGVPMVVENRPGSGGAIGLSALANASPDGYTIGFANNSSVTQLPFMMAMPIDPIKDLQPVSMILAYDFVILAGANFPASNVREAVAISKSRPGAIPAGIPSPGAAVILRLFAKQTESSYLHVPYKGGAPAMLALLSGEVSIGVFDVATTLPMVESGKVKALAVTGPVRSKKLANVPTVSESYPGVDIRGWFGMFAPKGTPRDRIDFLQKEFAIALELPEVKKTMEGLAQQGTSSSPEELDRVVQQESRVFSTIIKENRITAD